MPIDASIPLQVKQIELPNPLAQYAQMSQIQNYQNQNALAQYQLGAAQRTEKAQNVLSEAYQQGYDPVTGKVDYPKVLNYMAQKGGGAQIPAVQEAIAKREQEAVTLGKTKTEVAKTKQGMVAQAWRDISDRPSDANITAHLEDIVASPLYDAAEKAAVQKRANELLALPFADRKTLLASTGATAGELRPHITSVSRGGATDVIQTPAFGGAPTTIGNFPDVPLPPDVFAQQIQKSAAGAARTNVVMPAQEKEFEKELGSGQAKAILTSRTAAQDAAQILQTNQIGRDILKSGAITGAGADFFVGLNQALKTAGVDAGRADAAANSQAYAAAMASNTGKLIKQYGAGTGLSDADRDYAAAAAGGKIAMDEKAIRKVLDINDRAARNVINDHNKKVKGIKTNIPLTVEMPSTGGGNGGFTYLGKESK
jgi:hypothetical protein